MNTTNVCVAVLHEANPAPVINGVQKPRKPGGYKDAGSDIAYNLAHSGSENDRVKVLTPVDSPDPASVEDWTFPDTESGMLEAIEKGATILWAKTNLFASHPIQTSRRLDQYADRVSVVGQPPNLCDQLDDKRLLNDYLRRQGSFVLPRAWVISAEQDYNTLLRRGEIPLPVVGKPIRGRGSHGVKVCFTLEALHQHVEDLLAESPIMMLEEYLTGEEGTICVMPPTAENPDYSALSFVRRTDHQDGVIPYTGKVAAVLNSRALTLSELAEDPEYKIAMDQCEAVGRLIKTTAPIRIDVRRFDQIQNTKFALFDINLKPNMTGPGRPGRDDELALTGMAASTLGWDYPTFLRHILSGARPLTELRAMQAEIT